MYGIEKGIEMPAHTSRRRRYPFTDMEVGDSFFVPLDGRKAENLASSISGSARSGRAARANGRRYVTRTVVENGVKGVRCWRVE